MFKSITSAILIAHVAADGHSHYDYDTPAEQALAMSEDAVGREGSFNAVNGGLDIRVPAGKDVTLKRMNSVEYDTAALTDEILTIREGFAEVAVDGATTANIKDQTGKVKSASDTIDNQSGDIDSSKKAVEKAINDFGPISNTLMSTVDNNKANADAKADAAIEKLRAHVADKTAEIRAKVRDAFAKLKKETMDEVLKVEKPMTDFEKTTGVALRNIAKTHYVNKKAVVYRWNEWNGYSNNWGWFDGNNNRGYGGVHPSEWCDGNARAYNIHNEMRYVKRLFSKRGHGDAYGSTICAYNWEMMHSTDDHRCGAVFRIKNTGSSSARWTVQWWYSGWQGWGNRASVAINRNNHWHGDCWGICHRGDTFNVPSNSGKNRISTVIFMNGGSGYYYYHNHYRMSYLCLGSMGLPDGLEFVDDMETVGGNWN